MKDVKAVLDKVVSNSAKKSDYRLLEEYYLLAGISQEHVYNLYNECGFNDSMDFYQQRQRPSDKQVGNVRRALAKIEGTTEAVLEAVLYKIVKLKNLC